MKTKISILILLFAVSATYSTFAQLTILTGPEQLTYYRFVEDLNTVIGGEDTKPFINRKSSGSADNFRQITDPESPYKVALIQEDYLYFMKAYDSRMNTEVTNSLKVIAPLANEEIHVVTTKESGIKKLQDLQKKIVAIGTKNMGTYATASLIKDKSKVAWSSRNIHFDQTLNALFMGQIDAFFIVGTAPIEKLNMNPKALSVPLDLVELNDFNGWAKYYNNDTIRTTDYMWLDHDVPTFNVKTLLIVNESKLTDEDKGELSELINELNANLAKLKEVGHPKWKEVNLQEWDAMDWPLYK